MSNTTKKPRHSWSRVGQRFLTIRGTDNCMVTCDWCGVTIPNSQAKRGFNPCTPRTVNVPKC